MATCLQRCSFEAFVKLSRFSHLAALLACGALLLAPNRLQGVPIPGNPLAHYTAGNVTLGVGSEVATWHNQGSAGAALDAHQFLFGSPPATGAPQQVANALNGLPVINFASSGNAVLRTGTITPLPQPNTIIHVGLMASMSGQPYWYDGIASTNRNTFLHRSSRTDQYAGIEVEGLAPPLGSFNQWTAVFNSPDVSTHESHLNMNGDLHFYTANVGDQNFNSLIFGARHSNTQRLEGDIAEVLVYDRVLNAAEYQIVNNHLAAKYDLPLAASLYAGSSAANGDYDHDVFGIGSHAAITEPSQNRLMFAAGSVTAGTDGQGLTIEALSGLDPGDFVLAGTKGTANGITSADVDAALQRWQRVWYIDPTGDVETRLTFDWQQAGLGPLDPRFSQLYFSPTDPFSFTQLAISGVVSGDQISFVIPAGMLLDGYYTLGTSIIPEPASLLLLGFGTLGLVLGRRRRRNRA